MEYVLTAAEMKQCDEQTTTEYGIPSLVLMERAALETARIITGRYGTDISVGIVAGSGNNGGDGIAIARILQESGVSVQIHLIGEEAKCTEQTRMQIRAARMLDIPIHYGVDNYLYDVIVDAIFGIGISREIEGKYKEVIEGINESHAIVVSADMPSGIHTDSGKVMGCAIEADITVTYGYRKLGQLLYPGTDYTGELICVPIGIPDKLVENTKKGIVTFTKSDLRFPKRNHGGNKGTFGKVLV
ncbi:MAG: NAD(P)H-hydrate epimerase, partial [Lachnospiraceae bacterium]